MNLQLSNATARGDGAPTPAPAAAPRPAPAPVQAIPVAAVAQQAQQPQQPAPETVREAAQRASEALRASGANLEFQVDDESGKVIVRIVDGQTGDLIRQIPSEEMLQISRAIDRMQGLLVQQSA